MDVQKLYLLSHSEISDTRLYSTMKRSHWIHFQISKWSPKIFQLSDLYFHRRKNRFSATKVHVYPRACAVLLIHLILSSLHRILLFLEFLSQFSVSHCRVPETWSKHLLLLKVLTKGTSKQHNKPKKSALSSELQRLETQLDKIKPSQQNKQPVLRKNDHSGLYNQLLSKTWFI